MVQLHGFVVISAFSLMGIVLFIEGAILGRKGQKFLGTPSIGRLYFITGKLAVALCWFLFMAKAFLPDLGFIAVPPVLSWTGAGLLSIATLILVPAFINLGTSLMVGLPDRETTLKTGGVYRVSRNPIYLGVMLSCIASGLYFPDFVNIFLAVYAIGIHHRIIKGEEIFLAGRFGKDWEDYCKKVRRYI
jgi:protein-S-isoprenylcysteine O-methyltransferase Ste14